MRKRIDINTITTNIKIIKIFIFIRKKKKKAIHVLY